MVRDQNFQPDHLVVVVDNDDLFDSNVDLILLQLPDAVKHRIALNQETMTMTKWKR